MTSKNPLSAVLGKAAGSEGALATAVRRGIPTRALAKLAAVGWTDGDVATLLLDRRAQARRRKAGRLTTEESDRLVRLLRLQAAAERTFHGRAKALAWLRLELHVLGGATPFSVAKTDAGARLIENVLAGVRWGAPA